MGLPRYPHHPSGVPCPLPRRIGRVRASIASPSVRPSPFCRRVSIRISTFEACSGFTRVTDRRVAQPPKAAFVTRLRSGQLPDQTARQLPELSTIPWMDPSSTGDTRPRGARRVEERRGSKPLSQPRFPPRSSNRTCGFPASGFPTEFIVRHTAVIQGQNAEFAINRAMGKSSGSAVWYLMPPTEEVSDAPADVVIDGLVCLGPRAVAEVFGPATQQSVEPVTHLCPGPQVARHQYVVDLLLHTLDTFRGWARAQVSLPVPLIAMRTERVSQEVEALCARIPHEVDTRLLTGHIGRKLARDLAPERVHWLRPKCMTVAEPNRGSLSIGGHLILL